MRGPKGKRLGLQEPCIHPELAYDVDTPSDQALTNHSKTCILYVGYWIQYPEMRPQWILG